MNMDGKICMVTGASSGIGKAAATGLAKLGATVLMVCRDSSKAKTVAKEIQEKTLNKNIHLMIADLSSQRSIHNLVEEFKKNYDHLDVLINNAGGIIGKRILTEDGIELTFALNHLAYFLLTNLLLDELKKGAPSRIINVASEGHRFHGIDFDNLQGEKGYSQLRAYDQSKLCNILFTYELARRLDGTGITANCLHPGIVASNFGDSASFFLRFLVKLGRPFLITPKKASETIIYLASSPEVQEVSGKYFIRKKPRRSSRISYDKDIAKRLWDISASLTGLD